VRDDAQEWKNQAVGWLVSTVGRDFMLKEAERAERAGETEIALVLRDWMGRLTWEEDDALPGFREMLVRRATYELQNVGPADPHTEAEQRELAEAALRGAGVIR
jgi:hypothetical protein